MRPAVVLNRNRFELVPQSLADRLIGVFSRMEAALKAAGYSKRGHANRVEADWDKFALAIDPAFRHPRSLRVVLAVRYLTTRPPRQHVFDVDGSMIWRFHRRPEGLTDVQYLFRAVRQVRNNVVHGGKHAVARVREPGRDRLLVEHATTVLLASIALNPRVRAAYEAAQ